MKKISLLLFCLAFSFLTAQVNRIEPPNWWVGFKNENLQLLVHHPNIGTTIPTETFKAVNDGRAPHLLMDIHNESEVNLPSVRLSETEGPSHGNTFNSNSTNA